MVDYDNFFKNFYLIRTKSRSRSDSPERQKHVKIQSPEKQEGASETEDDLDIPVHVLSSEQQPNVDATEEQVC